MSLSPENRAIVAAIYHRWTAKDLDAQYMAIAASGLNELLNAARAEGPTSQQPGAGTELRESVRELLRKLAWEVFHSNTFGVNEQLRNSMFNKATDAILRELRPAEQEGSDGA